MIVIWRGAGCLALLLGIGLLVLSIFVGFGVVLGLAALVGGLLCWAVGSQDREQSQSSHLYFIPLQIWGVLFALGGVLLMVWGVFQWFQSGFPDLGGPALSWVWWLVGSVCGGVVLLAVCAVVGLMIVDSRKKNRVIREGDHTFAWLVYAKENLFRAGLLDDSALVLISPEGLTANDERRMADLADCVVMLRGRPADECDSRDKATVAELLRDETYVEGKRDRLPELFAYGREVYLAHLFVYRDHLPTQRITSPRIACAILWHEPNSLICTRPWKE
jgi:hypothetical protein